MLQVAAEQAAADTVETDAETAAAKEASDEDITPEQLINIAKFVPLRLTYEGTKTLNPKP